MKKLLFMILLLLGACTNVEKKVEKLPLVEKNNVYFKEDIAYNIVDNMLLNGILVEEQDNGNIKYSTFVSGEKIKEKLIDENKELVYDLKVNELGAISGLVVKYGNYNGEKYIDNYNFGVKNGESTVYLDGKEEVKVIFKNGLVDGLVKYYNYETGLVEEKVFNNGFESGKKGNLDIEFSTNFEKDVVDFKELELKYKVAKKDGELFTGVAVSLNKDGYMEESLYFEDGNLLEYTYYIENGIVAEKELYFGNGDSLLIVYNTDNYYGSVYYYNYMKDDVYNGAYGMYYEDDYTFIGNYKDGKLFGKGIYYNQDNRIEEVQDYIDSEYTTVAYYNYDNNQIRLRGQGRDENGVWKLYGRWEYYYEDGSLEEEIDFDGEYGKVVVYSQNGNKIVEGTVDAYYNFYEGEVKEYYESGKIKVISNYSEGYLNGESTYFDEEGNVTKVEVYDYEVLVEER